MTPQNLPNAAQMLSFNISIILYIAGTTAMALLISKAFKTAGFATQIGSMMYLMPMFLSLYLRVLQMKHDFAESTNKEFHSMEDDALFKKAKKGNKGLILNEKEPDQIFESPDVNSNSSSNSTKNSTAEEELLEGIFNDEEYFWEKYVQKSISLFPHSPFCDAALLCFSQNPMSDVFLCYAQQVFDAMLFLMIIYAIENVEVIQKCVRTKLYG
jgi:hypothetical protein